MMIDDFSGKTQHTAHEIRLTSSRVRKGFGPRPVLLIAMPLAMNATDRKPNSRPQA